jgi:dipeptidyl aminopeptidase/acylaminoacyl peptidase
MKEFAGLSCLLLPGHLVLIGVLLTLALPATADLPPRLPVEAFGQLPVMSHVEISPGGRNVAARLLDKTGKYGIVIFDLEQIGKQPPVYAATGDWDVNWIRWKTDKRLLISGRYSDFDGRVGYMQTRLIAVNADGSNMKWLVKARRVGMGGTRPQFADRVVDFQPDAPRTVLMGLNLGDSSGPRLYRVDIETDRREPVEPARPWIQRWWLDRQGRVRLAQGYTGYGNDAHLKTYYRADTDAEWQEIWDETSRGVTFSPVVFDKTDSDVIVVQSDRKDGMRGLYRFRLSSGEFTEELFWRSDVDLARVILDPAGREVEGVRYVTDTVRIQWFSDKMTAIQKDIQAQLPGWSIGIVSRAMDDSRMMVFASAADHSGRYYLYESASKTLRLFSNSYPELDPYDLARVSAVRYKARDGLEIPAYLTLPRAVSDPPEKPLPAIVMPHGGPEARDHAAFDPEVQMLANRGYAVLQMNFRGSSGYGAEFRKAGAQEWGEAIQDDITDGTRWLIDRKIADPSRICIAGGSFGGYAALMGVVREPGLYKCAVSVNGVTDLPDLINIVSKYGANRRDLAERIGNYWSDKRKLADNSPARRASAIQVPVLLVQSTQDGNVPPGQADKMADALKDAGKTFRYVKLQDEDHWLSHSETRLQYFRELDVFLADQLR